MLLVLILVAARLVRDDIRQLQADRAERGRALTVQQRLMAVARGGGARVAEAPLPRARARHHSCGQRDAARVAREAGSRYNLKRTVDPMLTSAITAAIAAVLTWLGIPPGPYIAGVWIAVKILVVAFVALLGWRAARRRSHAAPPPAGGGG